MELKLYALPIGMYAEEFVTILEIAVPELLFSISEQGSNIYDSEKEMKERYGELEEIDTLEMDEDLIQKIKNLISITKEETTVKMEIFNTLEPVITKALEEAQNSPQIQIASEADLRMIDQQDTSGKLIL
jgi:hypothetical protein